MCPESGGWDWEGEGPSPAEDGGSFLRQLREQPRSPVRACAAPAVCPARTAERVPAPLLARERPAPEIRGHPGASLFLPQNVFSFMCIFHATVLSLTFTHSCNI